jgi:hypothetical protein
MAVPVSSLLFDISCFVVWGLDFMRSKDILKMPAGKYFSWFCFRRNAAIFCFCAPLLSVLLEVPKRVSCGATASPLDGRYLASLAVPAEPCNRRTMQNDPVIPGALPALGHSSPALPRALPWHCVLCTGAVRKAKKSQPAQRR